METPPDAPDGTMNTEQDPLSPVRKFWLQGAGDDEWYRVWWNNGAPDIRSTESLHLSPVKVEECRQKYRGTVARLLDREPDFNELRIPGEARRIAQRIHSARDALLAWSRKPETPLDLSALARSIKAGSDIRSLQNGMALVFEPAVPQDAESAAATAPETPPAATLPQTENERQAAMREVGDRMIEALQEYGTTVADLRRAFASRLCLVLKCTHFAPGMAPDLRKCPEKLAAYLQQEHELYLIQQTVADCVGIDRMHVFYEGLSSENGAWERACEQLQAQPDNAQLCEQYRNNPSAPFGVPADNHRNIMAFLQQGMDRQAEMSLYLLKGDENFAIWRARGGDELRGRVHGLADSVQNAAFPQELRAFQQSMRKVMREDPAKYQALFDQFCREKRLQNLHPFVAGQLHRHIRQDEVGVLPFGADHVREGYHQPHSCDAFRGFQLEDYTEKNPELKDLRLIVIEPNGYRALNEPALFNRAKFFAALGRQPSEM
ncbi:MAG: hypothetical protein WCV62_05525 [Candidatus Peribacteraceae bacterium]|jgi:hypothetical protein